VQGRSRTDARQRVREVLDQVGLPQDTIGRLPREFSGGQRQRVAIARALTLSPKLIVCDEPVSALDLTTQARVLDLFMQIQKDTGVSYLFVSHDLDVVRHISHRVAVMYHGEIVEQGEAQQVTTDPEHPYTQRLLLASPVPDPDRQEERRANRRRLIETQREQDVQAGVAA
jgi:ABC-type oligopeptide transport system ATPase subunit